MTEEVYKESMSYGGWECKKCNHESPRWRCVHTNKPREGDLVKYCFYCGDGPIQIYSNRESRRELRLERYEKPETPKTRQYCQRCGIVRNMTIQDGPKITPGWKIAECVECGKCHDI